MAYFARNMSLKIDHLDPLKVLSTQELAWQAALKKIEVKLELENEIDMLLIAEKGIRRRICHTIRQYTKPNCRYTKNKNKKSSYLKYWDVNNLYSLGMS